MPSQSTEAMIESVHASCQERRIVTNPRYLNDENLPETERRAILSEVFNRNIREKQVQSIASHLAPILNNSHPQSALIYGPTGSGKTVTLIHVLASFKSVANRHNVEFRYAYVDLTHPKTLFGAFNEVGMALDPSIRRYRKGIPTDYMQGCIAESLSDYNGFLCLLIDEVDNIRPNPDDFLIYLVLIRKFCFWHSGNKDKAVFILKKGYRASFPVCIFSERDFHLFFGRTGPPIFDIAACGEADQGSFLSMQCLASTSRLWARIEVQT